MTVFATNADEEVDESNLNFILLCKFKDTVEFPVKNTWSATFNINYSHKIVKIPHTIGSFGQFLAIRAPR